MARKSRNQKEIPTLKTEVRKTKLTIRYNSVAKAKKVRFFQQIILSENIFSPPITKKILQYAFCNLPFLVETSYERVTCISSLSGL